jgi:hypothetical protein
LAAAAPFEAELQRMAGKGGVGSKAAAAGSKARSGRSCGLQGELWPPTLLRLRTLRMIPAGMRAVRY